MARVLQAALHRGRDVSWGRSRVGRRAPGEGGGRERRRGEARRKPADGQRPLVLALPLTQLQTAQERGGKS